MLGISWSVNRNPFGTIIHPTCDANENPLTIGRKTLLNWTSYHCLIQSINQSIYSHVKQVTLLNRSLPEHRSQGGSPGQPLLTSFLLFSVLNKFYWQFHTEYLGHLCTIYSSQSVSLFQQPLHIWHKCCYCISMESSPWFQEFPIGQKILFLQGSASIHE